MLLKIVGYVLALIVLLVCALLLVVRFQPQWLVATANAVQDDVQVTAESIGVTYAPLALQVENMDLALPGQQQVSLEKLSTQANFSAWWTDEPFWLVEVERADVQLGEADTAPEPQADPEDPAAAPLNFLSYLTFTKIRVGELLVEQKGVKEPLLRLQLNAGQQLEEGQTQDIQLTATGAAAGTTFDLAGTVTRRAKSLGFDLTGDASSAPDSAGGEQSAMQAQLALVGELSGGSKPAVLLSSGQIDLQLGEEQHLVQALAGGIRVAEVSGADGVQFEKFAGSYRAPGWEQPVNFAADLTAAAPDDAFHLDGTLQLGRSTVDLKTLSTKVAQSWHGTLSLNSEGLPPAISVAPYADQDLFPLSIESELKASATSLAATGLKVDSPTNALGGTLNLTFGGPMQAAAKLQAARLYLPLVSSEAESEEDATPTGDAKSTEQPEELQDAAAAGKDTTPASDEVFAKDPLDWDWLQELKLALELDAKELKLQDAVFTDFAVQLASDDGQLVLKPFSASIGNGGFSGAVELGFVESSTDKVASKVSLQVNDVELESFGFVPQEELQGGALEVDVELTTTGRSAHDLAAGLNGDLMIIVDEAVLMNDFIELAGSDLVMETLNKLNPFRKDDPTTELKCGLVHFSAEQGVLSSRKQLVMETSKMEIVGDGKVDLDKEQLSITFSPIAKSGIGLNVGSLVKFLKLGGRLNNPKPTADAGGLLKSGAAIGAAISTGGLSVVADGMASRALNAGSACAAIRKTRASTATAAAEKEPSS